MSTYYESTPKYFSVTYLSHALPRALKDTVLRMKNVILGNYVIQQIRGRMKGRMRECLVEQQIDIEMKMLSQQK
jgi:hypothetical protein